MKITMTDEVVKIILCTLEKIKYKVDLTPEPTKEEIKERKQKKEELEKMREEIERKKHEDKDIATQAFAVMGELSILAQRNSLNFELLEGKKVCLYGEDIVECRINFEDDLKNLLKKFKEEYGIIIDFREIGKKKHCYYEIALPKDFNKRCKEIQNKLKKVLSKVKEKEVLKKEVVEKGGNLITRDVNGEFYYKNKPIKFTNKEAIYYLIFECLYEKGNLDGFCPYDTINKYLEENGKEEYTDERQIRDRIKNGIMNLFRFSNLPSKTPNRKELMQKVKGKGIILYNPSL